MGESGLIMLEQDDTCSSSREGRIGFKDTEYIQFLGKKEVFWPATNLEKIDKPSNDFLM